MYEVVSPSGVAAKGGISDIYGAGLELANKRLGLVRIPFPNGDVLLETLAGLLKQRYGDLEIVKIPSGKNLSWGDYPDTSLTDVVKESGINAAMVAVGC